VCWGCFRKAEDKPSPVVGVCNGIRLYAAFRREVPTNIDEWTFGVELQPEWLLPLSREHAYSRWHLH
jgi:hypothetical protein